MPRSKFILRASPAFSLVELLLVMAILTILMAVIAPALSHSLRGRKLEDEASRFIALTEYARDEAISQGAPMIIWINGATQSYGLDPKNSYSDTTVHKKFDAGQDVTFDVAVQSADNTTVAEFGPDGLPTPSSAPSVRLHDRSGAAIVIVQKTDGSGYAVADNNTTTH